MLLCRTKLLRGGMHALKTRQQMYRSPNNPAYVSTRAEKLGRLVRGAANYLPRLLRRACRPLEISFCTATCTPHPVARRRACLPPITKDCPGHTLRSTGRPISLCALALCRQGGHHQFCAPAGAPFFFFYKRLTALLRFHGNPKRFVHSCEGPARASGLPVASWPPGGLALAGMCKPLGFSIKPHKTAIKPS